MYSLLWISQPVITTKSVPNSYRTKDGKLRMENWKQETKIGKLNFKTWMLEKYLKIFSRTVWKWMPKNKGVGEEGNDFCPALMEQ